MRRRPLPGVYRRQLGLTGSSREGAVAFRLLRRSSGLYIERLQQRDGVGVALHALCFEDEATFVDWCLADRLQFRYPLVYANLRRTGCALLSRAGTDPTAA